MVPFGHTNAPTTFMCLMNKRLRLYLVVTPPPRSTQSNHANRGNMRRDATTSRFNLLCHLKEVESMEHHIQSSNIINKTLIRQVSHSSSLSMVPTAILRLLGHSHSRDMGKGAAKNLNSLSHACLLTTVTQNYKFCASNPRI